MEVKEIAIADVEVSRFNVRKDTEDGQDDSTIENLAESIKKRGLLSPIHVFQKSDGTYGLIAGQRRLLACISLGWSSISAIMRDSVTDADATAISLVENVHRADMNPRDKATAFKSLLDSFGDIRGVSRETGVGDGTIRKYLQLLDLAPELQGKLAAGEAKNTAALSRLARRLKDHADQVKTWNQISGFTQAAQLEIIKRVEPDLENLEEVVDQAREGIFDARMIRNCPHDCPTIPDELKERVAEMISANGQPTGGAN